MRRVAPMPDIDDPFKPSDATVMRPRPGAGRRGRRTTPSPAGAALAAPRARLRADSRRRRATCSASAQSAGAGGQPAAAARRSAARHAVGAGSRRPAAACARRDPPLRGARARGGRASTRSSLAARYALCAASTRPCSRRRGARRASGRSRRCSSRCIARRGAARSSSRCSTASPRIPTRHIDLMELQYSVLALGFAGKYQVIDRGPRRSWPTCSSELYRKIRDSSRRRRRRSCRCAGAGSRTGATGSIRYVPWWVVGAARAGDPRRRRSASTTRGLAARPHRCMPRWRRSGSKTSPAASAPRRWPGRRSSSCWRPRKQAAALSVEEEGGARRVITLLAADLFASGSAALECRPTSDAAAAWRRRSNQVPGRVLVVGHTDDQPTQSLRYRDNFELSRERAVSVATILQRTIDDPARSSGPASARRSRRHSPTSDAGESGAEPPRGDHPRAGSRDGSACSPSARAAALSDRVGLAPARRCSSGTSGPFFGVRATTVPLEAGSPARPDRDG